MANEPVMAVIGVGIKRDVGDHTAFRQRILDRLHGAAEQIVLSHAFRGIRRFPDRIDDGKEGNTANAKGKRGLTFEHRAINRQSRSLGHRMDGFSDAFPFPDKDRQNQLSWCQMGLAHK